MLKTGADYEGINLVFATDEGQPIRYGNLTKRHFHGDFENCRTWTSSALFSKTYLRYTTFGKR